MINKKTNKKKTNKKGIQDRDIQEVRHAQMELIYDELIALTKSPLYIYRTTNNYFPVLGKGSLTADIMFIGEAPGKKEAETARPFCGRSGKILDEMMRSVGLAHEDVYITSIVKDRPPENRDPTSEEIAVYAPFLDRQIEIIAPKVIITLGRFSMVYIIERYGSSEGVREKHATIREMHGKIVKARASYGPVYIVPLYHPAVALYRGETKKTLFNDFQIITQFIKK